MTFPSEISRNAVVVAAAAALCCPDSAPRRPIKPHMSSTRRADSIRPLFKSVPGPEQGGLGRFVAPLRPRAAGPLGSFLISARPCFLSVFPLAHSLSPFLFTPPASPPPFSCCPSPSASRRRRRRRRLSTLPDPRRHRRSLPAVTQSPAAQSFRAIPFAKEPRRPAVL